MKNTVKLLAIIVLIFFIAGCERKDTSKEISSKTDNTIQSEVKAASEKKETSALMEKVTPEQDSVATSEEIESVKEEIKEEPIKIEKPKKTIVLDPGHAKGGNRNMEKTSPYSEVLKVKDPGGASGVSTGLNEYEVNLMVAKKLKALLENEGFTVIMTKNTEEDNPGNVERAEVGNNNNANLVLRIHCDSADNSSARGASMLVPEPVGYAEEIYEVSQQYGKTILDNFVTSTGAKNRGLSKRKDMTGFNWSKVPVVLIEMGFMSNPEEDELLGSDEYQNKAASGLVNGIKKALEQ